MGRVVSSLKKETKTKTCSFTPLLSGCIFKVKPSAFIFFLFGLHWFCRMSAGLKEAKQQREWLRNWTEQQLNTSVQRCTHQQDKMVARCQLDPEFIHWCPPKMQCRTHSECGKCEHFVISDFPVLQVFSCLPFEDRKEITFWVWCQSKVSHFPLWLSRKKYFTLKKW